MLLAYYASSLFSTFFTYIFNSYFSKGLWLINSLLSEKVYILFSLLNNSLAKYRIQANNFLSIL